MMAMPQPAAITRLTLLPTAPRVRGEEQQQAKIRRYRLAAVRAPSAGQPAERFAHLRSSYD